MRLAHPYIFKVFDMSCSAANTLVVENKAFFRSLVAELCDQTGGNPGNFVLSEENVPLEMHKCAELIKDFVPFSPNQKSLLTKLTSRLEKVSLSEEFFLQTQELLRQAELLIWELSQDLPCDISCSKMSVLSILRGAGIEIVPEVEHPLEQLLDYMELVRVLDRDKLFILINLRSYYEDDETEAFLRTVLDRGFQVLLMDSHAASVLPMEARWTIDSDLCEI